MILTDSEKILVALGALVIILAIVANAIKDYKRMTREANKKVEQKLKVIVIYYNQESIFY